MAGVFGLHRSCPAQEESQEIPDTIKAFLEEEQTPESTEVQDNNASPPLLEEKDRLPTINPEDFAEKAIFQAVDKITTRISSLTLDVGKKSRFGNLDITLHSCWKSPPEEEPESKSLVEIWEEIPGQPKVQRFYGWMFASSPALSALEHPVYDLTLIKCVHKAKPTPKPGTTSLPENDPKAVTVESLDTIH